MLTRAPSHRRKISSARSSGSESSASRQSAMNLSRKRPLNSSTTVSGEHAPKPVTVATAIELVASTKRDVDKQIQSDGPLGPDRNVLRGPFHASLPKTKFAADSALEQAGFEPSVPLANQRPNYQVGLACISHSRWLIVGEMARCAVSES